MKNDEVGHAHKPEKKKEVGCRLRSSLGFSALKRAYHPSKRKNTRKPPKITIFNRKHLRIAAG